MAREVKPSTHSTLPQSTNNTPDTNYINKEQFSALGGEMEVESLTS